MRLERCVARVLLRGDRRGALVGRGGRVVYGLVGRENVPGGARVAAEVVDQVRSADLLVCEQRYVRAQDGLVHPVDEVGLAPVVMVDQ